MRSQIEMSVLTPQSPVLLLTTIITFCGVVVGCSKDETATVASLKSLQVLVVADANGRATIVNNLPTDPAKLTEAVNLMGQLGALKSVTALEGTPLSDEHLATLGKVKTLVQLEINGGAVTDHGVSSLTGLKNLESLTLADNAISKASMTSFTKLKKLNMLNLNGTKVDGGYEALSSLSNLQWMLLGGAKISDADATAISQFPAITHVTLNSNTEISDSAVKTLKSNKNCNVDYVDVSAFEAPADQ